MPANRLRHQTMCWNDHTWWRPYYRTFMFCKDTLTWLPHQTHTSGSLSRSRGFLQKSDDSERACVRNRSTDDLNVWRGHLSHQAREFRRETLAHLSTCRSGSDTTAWSQTGWICTPLKKNLDPRSHHWKATFWSRRITTWNNFRSLNRQSLIVISLSVPEPRWDKNA